MAAFATPAELATFMQTATAAEATAGNPDLLDTARAQQLLDNASDAIRDECGWSITQETITGEIVSWYDWATGYIFLPTLRLTAFAMTVNGVAQANGLDYIWRPNGTVQLTFRTSMSSFAVVAVTWTHGYASSPQNPKAVCLEHAAARYPNPSRYRSETIEGVSTVYTSPDLETDSRLTKYRIRAI